MVVITDEIRKLAVPGVVVSVDLVVGSAELGASSVGSVVDSCPSAK